MKSILDIYLKEMNVTRYDIAKKTGISEQTLSKANKREPQTYTVKTIEAIAQGVNRTSGEVLDRLLEIREGSDLYIVKSFNELKQKVRDQEDEFLVQGEFAELIKEAKRETLSEDVELAYSYATGGSGTVVSFLLIELFTILGKGQVQEKEKQHLKNQINLLYTIQFLDQQTMKLRLKQLDY